MSMRKRYKSISWMLLVSSVAACGGGGGGGGGDDPVPDDGEITYTGLTSKAVIGSGNALDLLRGALGSSQSSGGFSGNRLGEVSADEDVALPRLFQHISSTIQHANNRSASSRIIYSKADTDTDVPCTDGGTYDYVYDTSAHPLFTGTFDFYACDESGVVLNGHVDLSGMLDGSNNLLQATMTFTALSSQSAAGTFTIKGEFSSDYDPPPAAEITINALIRNDSSSVVERLDGMVVTYTAVLGDDDTLEIEGNYYHPAYGYVVVKTNDLPNSYLPLKIADGDSWPYTGIFVIEGAVGSGGFVTKAGAGAQSSTQFTLNIDADGNGLYETVTPNTTWEP